MPRLDQDLGAQRDLVTKTKHERDEHRRDRDSGAEPLRTPRGLRIANLWAIGTGLRGSKALKGYLLPRSTVVSLKSPLEPRRQEYASLKQQTGIMNSEHLTKDFKAPPRSFWGMERWQERADRIKELKDAQPRL